MDPRAVLERWRPNLRPSALVMLKAILDAHPNAITPEELAQRLGTSPRARGLLADVGTLKRNGLVLVEPEGVQAHPDLFVGA